MEYRKVSRLYQSILPSGGRIYALDAPGLPIKAGSNEFPWGTTIAFRTTFKAWVTFYDHSQQKSNLCSNELYFSVRIGARASQQDGKWVMEDIAEDDPQKNTDNVAVVVDKDKLPIVSYDCVNRRPFRIAPTATIKPGTYEVQLRANPSEGGATFEWDFDSQEITPDPAQEKTKENPLITYKRLPPSALKPDGSIDKAEEKHNASQYVVTIRATHPTLGQDTSRIYVVLNQPPVASLKMDITSMLDNKIYIDVDGRQSYDKDEMIIKYIGQTLAKDRRGNIITDVPLNKALTTDISTMESLGFVTVRVYLIVVDNNNAINQAIAVYPRP